MSDDCLRFNPSAWSRSFRTGERIVEALVERDTE
jgi:hypothetical protein